MNTVRICDIHDIHQIYMIDMIYIRFIKMKLMLCGINNRLGTAEENTTKFEDIRINYPNSNTREKKTEKDIQSMS